MESSAPQFTPVEQPKKTNTWLIIGIVAVVLCCCCLVIVIAGLTILGPSVGKVFSTVNQGLENPSNPENPSMPSGTSEPSIPGLPSDLIPQGGLGDDLLRTNTWGYVITAAAMSGCSATDASKTTIDVLQQPDSSGAWKEKWTVTCEDGSNKSFDVSFTPSAQGGTDINVTTSK